MSSDSVITMAPSMATVISSNDKKAYSTLLHKATIAVIHEATLQDLLHCSNNAFIHILWEHNDLLCEHIKLGAEEIKYSEIDFLSPLPPPLPYLIRDNGYVLRCRATRPRGAWYPKDQCYVDASVQTDDPDSTLAEIDPDVLIEDHNVLNCEVRVKKRKCM
ncbi:hypothetical protein V8E53_015561 [Lactarius tabidus]